MNWLKNKGKATWVRDETELKEAISIRLVPDSGAIDTLTQSCTATESLCFRGFSAESEHKGDGPHSQW
jgi:hypothetical protein